MFGRTNTFIPVWNYLRVRKWWQIFVCVWTIPLTITFFVLFNRKHCDCGNAHSSTLRWISVISISMWCDAFFDNKMHSNSDSEGYFAVFSCIWRHFFSDHSRLTCGTWVEQTKTTRLRRLEKKKILVSGCRNVSERQWFVFRCACAVSVAHLISTHNDISVYIIL